MWLPAYQTWGKDKRRPFSVWFGLTNEIAADCMCLRHTLGYGYVRISSYGFVLLNAEKEMDKDGWKMLFHVSTGDNVSYLVDMNGGNGDGGRVWYVQEFSNSFKNTFFMHLILAAAGHVVCSRILMLIEIINWLCFIMNNEVWPLFLLWFVMGWSYFILTFVMRFETTFNEEQIIDFSFFVFGIWIVVFVWQLKDS